MMKKMFFRTKKENKTLFIVSRLLNFKENGMLFLTVPFIPSIFETQKNKSGEEVKYFIWIHVSF